MTRNSRRWEWPNYKKDSFVWLLERIQKQKSTIDIIARFLQHAHLEVIPILTHTHTPYPRRLRFFMLPHHLILSEALAQIWRIW